MICLLFCYTAAGGQHRGDVLQIQRLLIATIVHCCAERTKIAAKPAQLDRLRSHAQRRAPDAGAVRRWRFQTSSAATHSQATSHGAASSRRRRRADDGDASEEFHGLHAILLHAQAADEHISNSTKS